MIRPPDSPVFKVTVIRDRARKPRDRYLSDEEEEDEEERQDDIEDEAYVPQRAGGCAPTGLGCLVLLACPLVIWLLA